MSGPVDAKKAMFPDGQPTEKMGHLCRQVKVGRAKAKKEKKAGLLCFFFLCSVILMLRL